MTIRRLGAGIAVLGLALLAAAVLVAFGPARHRVVAGTARPPAASGELPGSSPLPRAPVASVPPPARDARLRLPRLRLDASIVPVRLEGRVLQVPRDPTRVGWWRQGARPGAARGSAVLVGHVDYAGTSGAFAVLPRARPGDRIVLTHPEVTFRVAAVRTYPKTSGIPQASFASAGPAQLVLITCGGAFDAVTGSYVDNVVVYAVRG